MLYAGITHLFRVEIEEGKISAPGHPSRVSNAIAPAIAMQSGLPRQTIGGSGVKVKQPAGKAKAA
jgi:hypothetical protein